MAIKLPSTAFVKDLVKRTKLVQHYEKAWTGWDGPLTFTYESKEKDDAFHPSGDCTPSSETLYFKALATMDGEDPDPVGTTLRKAFLVGHFWHQVYQDLTVKELGFAKPEAIERSWTTVWGWKDKTGQQEALPFHWARGSADIAPCVVPGNGEYLVDFKTMNSRDYGRCEKNKTPPNWTADKWECQMNIYMNWFDLEKALVVGINKDSPHDLIEFEYHRNQPLVDAIFEKWRHVSECLTNGERPVGDDDPPLPLMGVIAT